MYQTRELQGKEGSMSEELSTTDGSYAEEVNGTYTGGNR
jgi:hypothetical protein